MIRQRHVDGFDVRVAQPSRFQDRIQGRRVADTRRVHGELHALEIRGRFVAATVDVVLADQDLGRPIS